MHTDQPGVQFYTGNFIPEGTGKSGTKFNKHSGFSLETQNYPNSVNIVSIYFLFTFQIFSVCISRNALLDTRHDTPKLVISCDSFRNSTNTQ